jgi:hypothetical protein
VLVATDAQPRQLRRDHCQLACGQMPTMNVVVDHERNRAGLVTNWPFCRFMRGCPKYENPKLSIRVRFPMCRFQPLKLPGCKTPHPHPERMA